ncbi:MAG: ribokinase [Phormidesmis sp. RL_2_1]|nr:ribokinase [Phormidesmis sp. RL_2_1]
MVKPADVVVLGSLNMDLVAQVDRLPQPGETLTGRSFATVPGGKGANQAVAAARLGVSCAIAGRIGQDAFGSALRTQLMSEQIDVSALHRSAQHPSGTALIAVSPMNNQIIVIPGANGAVDEDDLARLTPYFAKAKVLLLQFEIPLPLVEKAAAIAHQAGLIVIVDPAPVPSLPEQALAPDFCEYISILTPNQTEAERLTGMAIVDEKSAIATAERLQRQGIEVVIVKLGDRGIVCATATDSFAVPAFPVQAIDTVAAGDAFNGGLAAALCQSALGPSALGPSASKPSDTALPQTRLNPKLNPQLSQKLSQKLNHRAVLEPAIRYANAVAALAVTQSGAQAAMPKAEQVAAFLRDRGHDTWATPQRS